MRARSFARSLGLRVLLVLIFLGPAYGGLFPEEDAPERPEAPVREALKNHEWFDYQRDDYHRYDPREIEVPEEGWNCQAPKAGVPEEGGAAVAVFLQLLVYLLIAAVLALIGYLIYRVIEERRNQPELSEEIAAATIDHSELPADLAKQAGVREPLSLKRLRELIESALNAGDARAACVYMYLFALLRLGAAGALELKNDQTARDYAAQLQRQLDGASAGAAAPASPRTIAVFRDVARFFEFALYRGRLPAEADAVAAAGLWRDLQAVIG